MEKTSDSRRSVFRRAVDMYPDECNYWRQRKVDGACLQTFGIVWPFNQGPNEERTALDMPWMG